jgi:hypothetical protein
MITRLIDKPNVQAMISALRGAGLTVDKLDAGYECKQGDTLLFKAMNGSQGYLVRMQHDLFTG